MHHPEGGTVLALHPDDAPDPAREALDLVHRLCRSLSARPSEDALVRSVVLDFPVRHRARTGLLARLVEDGSLAFTGQFGYVPHKSLPASLSLAEDWPLCRALRQSDPVVMPTSHDVAAHFPLMADGAARPRPFAATQLGFGGTPVGAIAVVFEDDLDDPDGVALLMRTLSDALGVYIGLQWELDDVVARHGAPVVVPEQERSAALTARQLQVLVLMAEGLGNGQIAYRIGWSESTVRHETMAIYRALAVAGRRDAVREARARGLIPSA